MCKLQSQYTDLKRKYVLCDELRENSGFSCDSTNEIPIAPGNVWTEYLKPHHQTAQFRTQALLYWQLAGIGDDF